MDHFEIGAHFGISKKGKRKFVLVLILLFFMGKQSI